MSKGKHGINWREFEKQLLIRSDIWSRITYTGEHALVVAGVLTGIAESIGDSLEKEDDDDSKEESQNKQISKAC